MKTRSILLSLVLVFSLSNITFAQSFTEKITYEEFVTWANNQDIDAYTLHRTEQTPDENFGDDPYYAVAFLPDDNTTNLMISISEIHTFTNYLTMPKYKDQPTFEINGHSAVYLPNNADYSTSMLWVEMPELDANVMILKSPIRSQEELIGIFNSLDFDSLIED